MKTFNNYILVKNTEKPTGGIEIAGDEPIVEVVEAAEETGVKKGDKVLYKGIKLEIRVGGEKLTFITSDDLIAVL